MREARSSIWLPLAVGGGGPHQCGADELVDRGDPAFGLQRLGLAMRQHPARAR